jgi:hypothetical protein
MKIGDRVKRHTNSTTRSGVITNIRERVTYNTYFVSWDDPHIWPSGWYYRHEIEKDEDMENSVTEKLRYIVENDNVTVAQLKEKLAQVEQDIANEQRGYDRGFEAGKKAAFADQGVYGLHYDGHYRTFHLRGIKPAGADNPAYDALLEVFELTKSNTVTDAIRTYGIQFPKGRGSRLKFPA